MLSYCLAGSGKTLAFLLPIVTALHNQKYQQQLQQQQQQETLEMKGSAGDAGKHMNCSERHTRQEAKRLKCSPGSGAAQSSSQAKTRITATVQGRSGAVKGSAESAKGSTEAAKGPSAVVLAPSRELAAQTARCLLLLLKGLKLRCTLLTASVAAGTDFSKVQLQLAVLMGITPANGNMSAATDGFDRQWDMQRVPCNPLLHDMQGTN